MITGKVCLVLAAALLAGCAGSIPVRVERPTAIPTKKAPDIFRGIPGKYRELASSAEKSGDLRRALLYRSVAAAFAPEDTDARDHVERLKRKIRERVEHHYRAALASEKTGETERALREFLAVLVLDPDHEEALRRVKRGRNGSGAAPRSWTVREGDTLRKIAGEAYRDPDKDFLIAWFNNLPAGAPLSVGTALYLPDVDTRPLKMRERANGYTSQEKEKEGNDHPDAVERKEGDERRLREADAHYAEGMRRFLSEDLDGAITEWGKALSLDPAHTKARRDIEKARRLKGKIEHP